MCANTYGTPLINFLPPELNHLRAGILFPVQGRSPGLLPGLQAIDRLEAVYALEPKSPLNTTNELGQSDVNLRRICQRLLLLLLVCVKPACK